MDFYYLNYTLAISIFGVFIFICCKKLFFFTLVKGISMEPNIRDGEYVIALKYWPKVRLRKGLVVICKPKCTHESYSYVKRIAGTPGERIVIELSVYERMLIPGEIYIRTYAPDGKGVWSIPDNSYFVLSDYVGFDSKVWGPISVQEIEGIVIGRIRNRNIKIA